MNTIQFNIPRRIKRFRKNYCFAIQFNNRDKVWVAYYRHSHNGARFESGIGDTVELAVQNLRERADIDEQDLTNEMC